MDNITLGTVLLCAGSMTFGALVTEIMVRRSLAAERKLLMERLVQLTGDLQDAQTEAAALQRALSFGNMELIPPSNQGSSNGIDESSSASGPRGPGP